MYIILKNKQHSILWPDKSSICTQPRKLPYGNLDCPVVSPPAYETTKVVPSPPWGMHRRYGLRTKKGQPLMDVRVEDLLTRVQKSVGKA